LVSGTGTAAGEPLRRLTTVYLDRGEKLRLTAATEIVMLHLGLPNLAGLEMPAGAAITAEAAE
jgi:hypothetical protein